MRRATDWLHASFTHAWRATDLGSGLLIWQNQFNGAWNFTKNYIYISAKANLRLAKVANVATYMGEGCGASGGGKLICLKRNSLSFGVFYFFKYARKRQRRSRCRSRGFDKTTTTTTPKTRTPYSSSSLPSPLSSTSSPYTDNWIQLANQKKNTFNESWHFAFFGAPRSAAVVRVFSGDFHFGFFFGGFFFFVICGRRHGKWQGKCLVWLSLFVCFSLLLHSTFGYSFLAVFFFVWLKGVFNR